MNVDKKLKKKHFGEKSHSVFEGLKGGQFEHNESFFSANFFTFLFNIHKK